MNPHFFAMKRNPAITLAILLVSVSQLCAYAPASAAGSELERALTELRASDAEWRRERGVYRSQRQTGQIQGAEAAEYAEFVASLQREKLENCENVRRLGGNEALDGTDCLTVAAANAEATQQASLPEPASTDAEKVGSLDEQLKALEAELDKELSDAQRLGQKRAAGRTARLPPRRGDADTNAGGLSDSEGRAKNPARRGNEGRNNPSPKWSDPGAENDNGENKNDREVGSGIAGGATASEDGADSHRTGKRDPGAGNEGDEKKEAAKADNSEGESGSDDDVVLRQIREAAEKEADPVLKEKLWEEYRKIKAASS